MEISAYVCVVAPKRKRESRKRKGYDEKLGRRKGVREKVGEDGAAWRKTRRRKERKSGAYQRDGKVERTRKRLARTNVHTFCW